MLSLASWILISLQLLSLHLLASGRVSGWVIGGLVQAGWLIYGLATAQYAFVIGCVVSLIVHTRGGLCAYRAATIDVAQMTTDR